MITWRLARRSRRRQGCAAPSSDATYSAPAPAPEREVSVVLVLDAEAAEIHDVAGLGTGAGQGLVDAEGLEPAVSLVESLALREAGLRDRTYGPATEVRVAGFVLALRPGAPSAGIGHPP